MRAASMFAAALTVAALAACASDEEGAGRSEAETCAELEPTYQTRVVPVLTKRCATCHSASGAAKGTRLIVSADDRTPSLAAVSTLVRERRGDTPLLLGKVVGENGHGGGAVLTRDSEDFRVLATFTDMVGGKCEGAPRAQPAHVNRRFLRRLTPDEYENTLVDLVRLPGYGKTLPVESREEIFDNIAGNLRTDSDYFLQILDNARAISESADLAWQRLASCTSSDVACAKTMIAEFGLRSFRRPVTADEVLRYTAVYEQIGAGNHERGIRAIVRGMLGSPHFLFRTELGKRTPDGTRNDLTPYEIASELSYLFWATMPDQALFDAARDGKLVTKEDTLREATRLLSDPRSRLAQDRFTSQWLNLALLADKAKDPMTFPSFDRASQSDLRDEALAFFTETIRAETDGTLRALLTSEHGWLSERGARFYGVAWQGPSSADGARKRVALPGRPGLLASAGLLAVGATATEPVAILRGKLVRTRLFCQHIGEPPASAAAVTAALPTPRDNRERAGQLLGNPSCAGCHQKMDPIGLGYEGFDAIGMPVPGVDTSGEILFAPSVDGAFDGPKALHEKLAASREVQACFSKLWMAHAYGVSESEEGEALAVTLAADFAGHDTRIASLLLALTQTEHFLRRQSDPEEEAPPAATPPAPGGGSPPGDAVVDVLTTPGVTYQAQPGYEDGGKEEGPGNWWIRGNLTNTTNQPVTGWAYRMAPRPGAFVSSSKVAVETVGDAWILRSGAAENQTLEANRSYYIELKLSK